MTISWACVICGSHHFRKAPLSATEALLSQMKAQHAKNKDRKNSGSIGKPGKGPMSPANGGTEKSPELEECPPQPNKTSSNYTELNGRNTGPINLANPRPNNLSQTMQAQFSSYEVPTTTNKLLKPISGLDFPNDDARYFAEMIQRVRLKKSRHTRHDFAHLLCEQEIVVENLDVTWEDVIGLDDAKCVLEQALCHTEEFMEFFGNGLHPWKGLLLYGPPGVGTNYETDVTLQDDLILNMIFRKNFACQSSGKRVQDNVL